MARFSNSSGSLYLNIYIDQGAQNIPNNTSTVNWRVTVSRTGAYYTYNQSGDSTLSVSIDDRQIHFSNPLWETRGEECHLASGSHTVGHNADGTKSVSISADFNPNNGYHGRIITSGSIALTTIPRSSSVSVGTGTIGSGLTININRQSSSFKHTVRYQWGNKTGTIATNVDTSTTWTIPMDFCNDIPNSTSGQGTIFVDTYSGSTLTGTQSTTFRATVPDTVKPTLTGFTLIDGNTAARQLIPGGQQFIQIISNIAVHFGQTIGAYGSTITGYYAEIVGKNQSTTTNGGSLGIMNYNGNATVRAWVTDSRGRTSNVIDRTVTVLEYFAPVFNFRIERSGVTSSTLTAIRNARVAPLTVSGSQRNSMTLTFRVAPSDSSSYTTDDGPASGIFTNLSSLVNSPANLFGTYGADRSWDVLGILEDKFTRTEFRVKVSTEEVVFSYDKENRFAVGKITDSRLPKGSIESTGGYYLNGKPIQNHQLSTDAGYCINISAHPDTITLNGFYYLRGAPSTPKGRNGYLLVQSYYDGRHTSQTFTDVVDARMYSRRRANGTWNDWIELVFADHPNLVNTSWLSTGVSGVYYKRQGDVVALKIQVTTIADQHTNLGRIPVGILPIPNSGTMFRVTAWTTEQSIGRNLQINSDGSMALLPSGRADTFNTQITWII
ncbi:DUF859 domain-containing protein [Streptococcus suis]|nr:DUF859 domain-containing protein [Streptococcus suis]